MIFFPSLMISQLQMLNIRDQSKEILFFIYLLEPGSVEDGLVFLYRKCSFCTGSDSFHYRTEVVGCHLGNPHS